MPHAHVLFLLPTRDLVVVSCSSHRNGLLPKVGGCRSRWILVLQLMALLLPVVPLRAQSRQRKGVYRGPATTQQASAADAEELAKEAKNPFADLIQVQVGNDFGFGGDTGSRLQYDMTVQPIIPIKINDSWNLITRSNFSVISMPDSDSGMGRITGASDLLTEFYFSPDKQTPFIWGFGPALGIPTASEFLSELASGRSDLHSPLSSRPSTGNTA